MSAGREYVNLGAMADDYTDASGEAEERAAIAEETVPLPRRDLEAPTEADFKSAGLKAVTAAALLEMEVPPQEVLLGPWLHDEELAFAYAPRGLGKTLFAMGAAIAVAGGGEFLGWKAGKPRRVLYVDGELPLRLLQRRVELATRMSVRHQIDPRENLSILTPGVNRVSPNIAEEEGRRRVEDHIEGVELLILDATSTLCRGGVENEAESWQPMQDWLVRLRAARTSVLVLHHAGKNGQQRGTSKREDIFDWILALRHPGDYEPAQGARFEVHFEKTRDFAGGAAVEPFEARIEHDGPRDRWTTKVLTEAREERIIRLAAEGLTHREIAAEIGIRSHTTVGRILKKIEYRPDSKDVK
jgi:hypothetical protein